MLSGDLVRCAEKELPILEDFDICPVCERTDDGDLRDLALEAPLFEPPTRVARDLPVDRVFEDPL